MGGGLGRKVLQKRLLEQGQIFSLSKQTREAVILASGVSVLLGFHHPYQFPLRLAAKVALFPGS